MRWCSYSPCITRKTKLQIQIIKTDGQVLQWRSVRCFVLLITFCFRSARSRLCCPPADGIVRVFYVQLILSFACVFCVLFTTSTACVCMFFFLHYFPFLKSTIRPALFMHECGCDCIGIGHDYPVFMLMYEYIIPEWGGPLVHAANFYDFRVGRTERSVFLTELAFRSVPSLSAGDYHPKLFFTFTFGRYIIL